MLTSECDLNIVSGEVTQTATEIFLPGPPPFSFVRRYSSVHFSDGPLGYGWRHNLLLSLRFEGNDMVLGGAGMGEDHFVEDKQTNQYTTEGGAYTIEWDGLLAAVRGKDGGALWFEPDSGRGGWFRLRAREDKDRNRIEYRYTGTLLTDIYDAQGRLVRFQYDWSGRLVRISLSHSSLSRDIQIASYDYDLRNDLVAAFDRSGVPVRYGYDDHRLVQITNQKGGRHFFAYDSEGACVERWRSDGGKLRRFRRDLKKGRVEMMDSRGNRWLYRLNDQHQITQRIDPLLRVRENVYDPQGGLLLSTLDNAGVNCVSVFDELQSIEITSCAGNETITQYNQSDQPLRIEGPGGQVATFAYDDRGHLVGKTSADGATTRFTYSPNGELTALLDQRGNDTRFVIDGFSVRYTDLLGNLGAESRDPLGNLVSVRDPYDNITQFIYNAAVGLEEVVFSDGGRQRFRYDPAGYPSDIEYENGSTVQLESDLFGRPSGFIDGNGARYLIEWDAEDNYTQVTNPLGERLELAYDACNRLDRVAHFDGRISNVESDEWDRPARYTNPNSLTSATYQFNELGEVQAKSATNAPHWMFGYGPAGQLLTAASELGDWKINWTQDGVWAGDESPNRRLKVLRDPLGRRVSLQDDCGLHIEYKWDIRSRLTEMTVNGRWTWRFEYDLRNMIVRSVAPGNLELSFAYDSMGRMLHRTLLSPTGRLLASRKFQWTASDDLIQSDDSRLGVRNFEVDRAGRLLSASGYSVPLEQYAHDAAGNILTSARNETIGLDRGNRVVSSGRTTFSYNADGHMEQRTDATGTTRYTYDGNGCLTRVALPDGGIVDNTYDFLSRRLTKTVDGTSTRFFWDGEFLQGEQKDGGEPVFYITLPESPIPLGMIRDGRMHILLFDQIGTVTEAFEEAGDLSWASDYTAFYYLRQETAAVEQPIRALGQFHDRETGLYYNYFRHYDPLLGRYVSADPAGYTYALNLYWYSSNPYVWVDVDGQGSLDANGVLTLNWRCDWTAAQKRDFLGKLKDQNNALKAAPATVSLPAPERPCGTAAKKWEKCKSEGNANSKRPVQNTGDPCKDNDADHRMELVLGGKDNCANMTPRNASVNRSVGSQIGNVLSRAAKAGATAVTITKVTPSTRCKPPDGDTTPCKQNWTPNAAF